MELASEFRVILGFVHACHYTVKYFHECCNSARNATFLARTTYRHACMELNREAEPNSSPNLLVPVSPWSSGPFGVPGLSHKLEFRSILGSMASSGKSGRDAGSPHKLELRTLGTPQPAGTQNGRELLRRGKMRRRWGGPDHFGALAGRGSIFIW